MSRFSGTYQLADVEFLLQVRQIPSYSIAQKEALIGQGVHYGHLLSREQAPSALYQNLFTSSLARNAPRLAQNILSLAHALRAKQKTVLVSLARGGTPIGVLLKRSLELLGVTVKHYSVSIIRDHGIDALALATIAKQHDDQSLAFIDGWTGKGMIAKELKNSVSVFNQQHKRQIASDLWVLSDPAGVADTAATRLDYLLPNAMLNSTISGLISRSTLSQDGGYHAVMELPELAAYDVSSSFVSQMMAVIEQQLEQKPAPVLGACPEQQQRCQKVITALAEQYHVSPNYIKPSIGEATRVLLRRQPQALLLRYSTPDTLHLEQLAAQKCPIIYGDIPYAAIAIIDRHHPQESV